jgi:hypothetical protein
MFGHLWQEVSAVHKPCWTLNRASDGAKHQEMTAGYNYDAPDSVHQLPFDRFPDFEPDFNSVLIGSSAKLTDLISSVPIHNCGLLISGRFRSLLESFSLPPHCFYAVPMIHRKKPVPDYWWLHLPQPSIAIPDDASVAEVEALIESQPALKEVDLLRLYWPQRFAYCFVSDTLRRALDNQGITGVRFGTAKLFR